MTKFVQFRILVALLAAFAGFFAYVCRLNLSLVIHEMAVDDDSDLPLAIIDLDREPPEVADTATASRSISSHDGRGGQVGGGGKSAAIRLPNLRFEEQTLAALSAARPWWVWRDASKQRMPIKRRNEMQPIRKTTMSRGNGNLVEMLSIGFDVPPANPANAAGDQDATVAPSSPRSILDPLPKLHWSKKARNDLLGALFLGYVAFQVPAARGAEIFGAKTLLLITGFGTALTSILFVLSARLLGDAIWAAYLVRFLMGASQAGLFPATYVLYCRWLPKNERSYWLPVPSAMGRFGTIAMNFFAPLIVRHHGWPMVFIISGGVTLAWSILFLVLASSSPSTSRWLPSSELLYIESHMEPRVGTLSSHNGSSNGNGNSLKSPVGASCTSIDLDQQQQPEPELSLKAKQSNSMDWFKVMTNRPIALLALVMFASEWSNMLLLILLPSFLGPALGMELEEIGTWTIYLVAVYCVGYPLAGAVASRFDHPDSSVNLSSLNVRKLFEAVACLLQALGCLLIGLYGSKTIIILALFIIMLGRSTVGGGQCLMPPELSKEYPGTVMAYANALANLAGYFGPQIVNLLVEEPNRRESWSLMWFLSAALFIVCGLLFVLFAENSQQQLSRKQGPAKSTSQVQLTLPPYLPPPPTLAEISKAQDSLKGNQKRPLDSKPATQTQRPSTAAAPAAAPAAATDDPELADIRAPKRRVINEDIQARMSAFANVSSDPAAGGAGASSDRPPGR